MAATLRNDVGAIAKALGEVVVQTGQDGAGRRRFEEKFRGVDTLHGRDHHDGYIGQLAGNRKHPVEDWFDGVEIGPEPGRNDGREMTVILVDPGGVDLA
jgi:hypothetical protein